MDQIALAAGYVSRHFLPRGRGRVAQILMRYGPKRDLAYRDEWGYRRVALLSDEMEAYGFTGVHTLPAYIMKHIRQGDWVIDVGANVGRITALLCHAVGPAGLVWAVEPMPRNLRRLQQLKRRNSISWLRIYPGALGSTTGTELIKVPAEANSGYASFTRSWGIGGELQVKTWRLDDMIEQADQSHRLKFIKIDVEGFEPQVLQGAAAILQHHRPLVYCEFNDILLHDAGTSSDELLSQFRSLGYTPVGDVPPLAGQVLDLLLAHGG